MDPTFDVVHVDAKHLQIKGYVSNSNMVNPCFQNFVSLNMLSTFSIKLKMVCNGVQYTKVFQKQLVLKICEKLPSIPEPILYFLRTKVMRLKNYLITSRGFVPVLITSQHWFEFWTPDRVIRKVTLSFTPYPLCFHPLSPLLVVSAKQGNFIGRSSENICSSSGLWRC